MKVSDLIELLAERYDPDDEIYVEWWDKGVFDHDPETPISDEAWGQAVEVAQANPIEYAMGAIYDQLWDALEDAMTSGEM